MRVPMRKIRRNACSSPGCTVNPIFGDPKTRRVVRFPSARHGCTCTQIYTVSAAEMADPSFEIVCLMASAKEKLIHIEESPNTCKSRWTRRCAISFPFSCCQTYHERGIAQIPYIHITPSPHRTARSTEGLLRSDTRVHACAHACARVELMYAMLPVHIKQCICALVFKCSMVYCMCV